MEESTLTTATLYTIKGCSKCSRMREYLLEHNIPFEEVDIIDQPKRSQEILQIYGQVFVPFLNYQGQPYTYNSEWENLLKLS